LSQRYFIEIAFQGTRYHGWQIQANAPTVQAELNRCLSLLTGEEVTTTGAGRTDTGVNACSFTAHFDSSRKGLSGDRKFLHQLNSVIPDDISILGIRAVMESAHARFDALDRTYNYRMHARKDPFSRGLSWFFPQALDLENMQEAGKILLEYNDFKCFSKSHTDVNNYQCIITQAFWKFADDKLEFSITANRFLRNMVRAIVGSMIDIGLNKNDLKGFRAVIESRDRSRAGQSVPAHGLYMTSIRYPTDIFIIEAL
jgi:tRNA pseudouridine38-40 synthase